MMAEDYGASAIVKLETVRVEWLRGAISFAIFSVLCVIVSGCSVSEAKLDDAPSVADGFLAALRLGNIDPAWEGTTSEFKSFMGRDRLRSFVKSAPVLAEPATLKTCQQSVSEGLSFAECIYAPKSAKNSIKVLLSSQSGQWKVERLYVE